MNISITFAKLAGLYKIVKPTLDGARLMYRTGATGIRPQSNILSVTSRCEMISYIIFLIYIQI